MKKEFMFYPIQTLIKGADIGKEILLKGQIYKY